MKLSKILYRALRRLHLHGVFYNALYRWFSSKVPVDATAVSAAEQRLQALYPDKGQSSLCFNEEVVPHECDLQVIIPVYNAEQYIVRCVDSVLSQHTTYSFRVVVVDDGSDDGTPELLSAYADHPWVTVISQSNKGHSGARNAALARLIGRYVMFVDADDKLAQGAIESLMSQAYGCDADIVEGCLEVLKTDSNTIWWPLVSDEFYERKKDMETGSSSLNAVDCIKYENWTRNREQKLSNN